MADIAGITHSQARDTEYRLMQEVNCLYTDNRPLQVGYYIVASHTVQPSSSLYRVICFQSSALSRF